MNVIAALLLVVSVWLAVLLGPDLSMWRWGASLLVLGLAMVAAVPGCWVRVTRGGGRGLVALGVATAGWFAWRAWASPVAEFGLADGLLVAGVAGCFLVVRTIQERVHAERVFVWGIALLVLASVVVLARQVADPGFSPGFVGRFPFPSGFFGHYNDGANFLIGSACLTGGMALVGRYSKGERLTWGLIAIAGLVAVWFTRSRGGIAAAGVALAVFAIMAMIVGRRQGVRWFAAGVVALPVIGLLAAGFVVKGWTEAQAARNQSGAIESMMDNEIRLHMIDIAASCVGLHPWQGGGSRSFSWECNRFWETDSHGLGGNRPEQVHNEIMQAAADYGIIGAGLLVLLVGGIVVMAVIRSLFAEPAGARSNVDAWRLGGVAGLAGMLIQSNFSFVFHLLPGALMLGLCLGGAAHPGEAMKTSGARATGSAVLASALALACAALLVSLGWMGVRVTAVMCADNHGKRSELSREARIGVLTEAIRRWPLGEFFMERAGIYQKQAAQAPQGTCDTVAVTRAADDYRQAAAANPFAPWPVVNQANLLALLGQDAEALKLFDRGIELQGGMEAGYKAGYSKAAYLRDHAERLLAADKRDEAVAALVNARDTLARTNSLAVWGEQGQLARSLRISIGDRLAVLLSLAGRDREAENEFEATAAIGTETGIRYLYACHLRMKAKRVWYERNPAEALGLFIRARYWLDLTGNHLPAGVKPEDCAKFRGELDECIAFLKGAQVEPAGAVGP